MVLDDKFSGILEVTTGKRRFKNLIKVGCVVCLFFGVPILYLVVMYWPPFTPMETRLTGIKFKAQLLHSIDTTSIRGEGFMVDVWRLPDTAAEELATQSVRLQSLPMFSVWRASDGDKRLLWLPLEAQPPFISKRFIGRPELVDGSEDEPRLDAIHDLHTASEFANRLAVDPATLVSGWYRKAGTALTDYEIYLLNLDRKLMIKLYFSS